MSAEGERTVLLHGKDFLAWLEEQGIIPDRTQRVVIDAAVNEPVRVYVQQIGQAGLLDKRLLDVRFEVIAVSGGDDA